MFFDAITMLFLEYIRPTSTPALVNGCARLLRQGGRLITTVPSIWLPHDHEVIPRNVAEAARLLRAASEKRLARWCGLKLSIIFPVPSVKSSQQYL